MKTTSKKREGMRKIKKIRMEKNALIELGVELDSIRTKSPILKELSQKLLKSAHSGFHPDATNIKLNAEEISIIKSIMKRQKKYNPQYWTAEKQDALDQLSGNTQILIGLPALVELVSQPIRELGEKYIHRTSNRNPRISSKPVRISGKTPRISKPFPKLR